MVLKCLQNAGLQYNIKKYKFHVTVTGHPHDTLYASTCFHRNVRNIRSAISAISVPISATSAIFAIFTIPEISAIPTLSTC